MQIGYGLTSTRQATEIADRVVQILGGGDNAYCLLLETARQETKLGKYADPSAYGAGIGLCQCDPIAFTDTQERISESVKGKISDAFSIDIDSISHRELAYSPLLAFLWCRRHYLLRPGAIPDTAAGRAEYWKEWYNSRLGKGTVEEYVHNSAVLGNIC